MTRQLSRVRFQRTILSTPKNHPQFFWFRIFTCLTTAGPIFQAAATSSLSSHTTACPSLPPINPGPSSGRLSSRCGRDFLSPWMRSVFSRNTSTAFGRFQSRIRITRCGGRRSNASSRGITFPGWVRVNLAALRARHGEKLPSGSAAFGSTRFEAIRI